MNQLSCMEHNECNVSNQQLENDDFSWGLEQGRIGGCANDAVVKGSALAGVPRSVESEVYKRARFRGTH